MLTSKQILDTLTARGLNYNALPEDNAKLLITAMGIVDTIHPLYVVKACGILITALQHLRDVADAQDNADINLEQYNFPGPSY